MVAELSTAPALGQDIAPETDDAPLSGPLSAEPQGEIAPSVDGTEPARPEAETETADPLAGFDEDTLKANPRVKALLEATEKSVDARKEESFRQRIEREQATAKARADEEAYQRGLQELDAVEKGSIVQSLRGAFDRAMGPYVDDESRARLQAELPALGQVAEQLQRANQLRSDRLYVDAANAMLTSEFPDYAIPPELVNKFDQALHRGDFRGRITALSEIIRDATVKTVVPKERASIARELKAQAEAELKLTQQRAAERAASDGARPTNVAGRGTNGTNVSYASKVEASRLFLNGQIDIDEMRRARMNPALPEN